MDSEENDIMALLAKVIAEGKASPIQFVLDSIWSNYYFFYIIYIQT